MKIMSIPLLGILLLFTSFLPQGNSHKQGYYIDPVEHRIAHQLAHIDSLDHVISIYRLAIIRKDDIIDSLVAAKSCLAYDLASQK